MSSECEGQKDSVAALDKKSTSSPKPDQPSMLLPFVHNSPNLHERLANKLPPTPRHNLIEKVEHILSRLDKTIAPGPRPLKL